MTTLAQAAPEIAEELLAERSGFTAEEITHTAKRPAWWRCGTCSHEWSSLVASRTKRRSGCPKCALIARGTFADHCPAEAVEMDVARSGFSPSEVARTANRMAWWRCSDCGHRWEALVSNRARGSGCTACRAPGLTAPRLRKLIRDSGADWYAITPAARRKFFSDFGVFRSAAAGRTIVEALLAGELHDEQFSLFLDGEEAPDVEALISEHDPSAFGTGRKHIELSLRRTVYARDGWACIACGATESLSCDHVKPHSKGGPPTVENLVTLCISCNSIKKDREMPIEAIRARKRELDERAAAKASGRKAA